MERFTAALASGDMTDALNALRQGQADPEPPAAALQQAVNRLRKAQTKAAKLRQQAEQADLDLQKAQQLHAQACTRLKAEMETAQREAATQFELIRQIVSQGDASGSTASDTHPRSQGQNRYAPREHEGAADLGPPRHTRRPPLVGQPGSS
jgi:multidrug resistance efflux pump